MSQRPWQKRGYVQDSDEEDDDIETLSNLSSSTDTANDKPVAATSIEASKASPEPIEIPSIEQDEEGLTNPTETASSSNVKDEPTILPSKTPPPIETAPPTRDQSESPDPLQRFPTPIKTSHSLPPDPAPSSDLLLELLRDDLGSDDSLSDPPTDLDEPPVSPQASARRPVVQVIIPPHGPQTVEETSVQRIGRSLRERKPIQLNPYRLEQEKYRQDCKRRGIKPLAVPRSPERPPRPELETQEEEFDPNNDGAARSSPELPVFSPPRRRASHGDASGKLPRLTGLIGLGSRNSRRHFTLTQPSRDYASGRKKRRLNNSLGQEGLLVGGNSPERAIHGPQDAHDVWNFPLSPEASSPLPNGRASPPFVLRRPPNIHPHPARSLLTPSDSSSVRETSTNQSSAARCMGRFRPIVDSPDSSPQTPRVHEERQEPPPDDSGDDSQSEVEVRRIGKKIKGVLPASFLRLDKVAQERCKAIALERMQSKWSPSKASAQKGVARRRIRPSSSSPRRFTMQNDSNTIIVLSDDESDTGSRLHSDTRAQMDTQEASELAAIADSRYADYADDDLAGMENDRLPLFTLGGNTRKRKQQQRLDFPVRKPKKARMSDETVRRPQGAAVPGGSRPKGVGTKKIHRARRTGYSPPPLSIVDAEHSPSRSGPLPQFVRLALRNAQRRPDAARQSPKRKHIRLRTAQDTEDASSTLRGWRQGTIKAKPASIRPAIQRQPLTNRSNNLLHPSNDVVGHEEPQIPDENASDISPPRVDNVQEETHRRESTAPNGIYMVNKPKHLLYRGRSSFRPAQLEALESDVPKRAREVVFERGSRRAQQQAYSAWMPPLLERFLANDEADIPPSPPPLPSPPPVDDIEKQNTSDSPKLRPQRRRLRKFAAKRLDVETREFRQPSEADPLELVGASLVEPQNASNAPDQSPTELEGLGPYGAVYATTFDISPLAVGTYFHIETFIGSGLLQKSVLMANRDLDVSARPTILYSGGASLRCSAWNDETRSFIFSTLDKEWTKLPGTDAANSEAPMIRRSTLRTISSSISRLVEYLASSLYFLDVIDRQDFTAKMLQMIESQYSKTLEIHSTFASENEHETVRIMSYLLVISAQVHLVAHHAVVDSPVIPRIVLLITKISKIIVQHLVHKGVHALGQFLENNKVFNERHGGIQAKDVLAESLVITMHILHHLALPGASFWDLVSAELSELGKDATHVKKLDSVWAAAFIFLPYTEIDVTGILEVKRRFSLSNENWVFIKALLSRVFSFYADVRTDRTWALNEYVRANLRRCHVLISYWHWVRCDAMLTTVFDFFKNHGFTLPREERRGSPRFLQHLDGASDLSLEAADSAFHIFLKCLGIGIQGMRSLSTYTDKKIQGIVFRCTPNHGRTYPKDQGLQQKDLDALRNHHDLLCTLYWAAPSASRPRFNLLPGLVRHDDSHREACRLNVRVWRDLTMFQLSTDEPYDNLQRFAKWHDDIMQSTWKQYRLAKREADDFLAVPTDISVELVRATMVRNQEQVIGTIRDCVAGIQGVVQKHSKHPFMHEFLVDSGFAKLLELVHADDPRLTALIREALATFRDLAESQRTPPMTEEIQPRSEESQDYGDFPDLDDIDLPVASDSPLEFWENPLWRLMSNVFGAEQVFDDNVLMDCVDTWAQLSCCQVATGARSWTHYIGPFGPVSWQQLRDTEQTRKLRPYLMAQICTLDPSAYRSQRLEFLTTLLVSLVERESMLRFQHRLLHALVQPSICEPLLRNIPFHFASPTSKSDINAETLKSRRVSLLSSILANMQDDIHTSWATSTDTFSTLKRDYTTLLDALMHAMKKNHQDLGTSSTGAYVSFVQQMVQFLKEYTSDICPVHAFFLDPSTFPLPAEDPTYVVGRLRGYAPKLSNPGVMKQLSTFIQAVAERAAQDGQGAYLVHQLSTALCNDDGRQSGTAALRSALLAGVFPAYINAALSSAKGFVIAQPILRSLNPILEPLIYELRIYDADNVQAILFAIYAVFHAFLNGMDQNLYFEHAQDKLEKPHVLATISQLIDAMTVVLPTFEYILARTAGARGTKPDIIRYLDEYAGYLTDELNRGERMPLTLLTPDEGVELGIEERRYEELLEMTTRSLDTAMRERWTELPGSVVFGSGMQRKRVVVDVGNMYDEVCKLEEAIRGFRRGVRWLWGGGEDEREERGREFLADLVV
ncbi:hypothetical protein M011DRAFT_466124 [Sporormia fimetaria CBS 119925]|uniref:Mus7/MMS22 family-domain-containing protein n=1 Tax=Sporormia fimetaria CBS 119925 TaxID=1340428 RepID=A0A6A6VH11_9PLEO|nr:hypothetical protein M011DRAFT_466124 [Sporormia fimetaria CBS 119925]